MELVVHSLLDFACMLPPPQSHQSLSKLGTLPLPLPQYLYKELLSP